MLTWVKSVLLEEIASLREEIMDAEANFGNTLEASLQAIACTSSDLGINGKAYVVFLDSYLSNGMACAKISQFKIVTVLPFEAKESAAGQIAMVDAAQHIHNSKMVLISADVILKNGGILCRSGSLLLCRIANMCNVPVFALSRSYCHSDELISTQKALLKRENPLNYFAVDESQFNSFKVHVGKASDYIEPKLLRGLITE